jgi:hypothetical protein
MLAAAAAAFLLLWGTIATLLLIRAGKRLLQFDMIFQMIVEPMQEYSDTLKKLTTGEGLLQDNPEVMQFHRTNVNLLKQIEASLEAVRQEHPRKIKEKLPRPESV